MLRPQVFLCAVADCSTAMSLAVVAAVLLERTGTVNRDNALTAANNVNGFSRGGKNRARWQRIAVCPETQRREPVAFFARVLRTQS